MERKLIEEFDKKQKSYKQKRNKDSSNNAGNKTKQLKTKEPEFVPPSTYRDRAKERREGLNKDFELDPDDLRFSNPVSDVHQLEDSEQSANDEDRRRQEIEESKYLGGDVEHTHLVKGLDFALLEKVKSDQKLAEKLANDREENRDSMFTNPDSDSEEEEFINEAILAASSSANSKRQMIDLEKLKKGKSTEIIPCRTAIARRILNVLDEKWPDKSELFLPGRMSYIIPIGEDCQATEVTTVLRSKADTSAQDDGGAMDESDLGLEQLINILGKIRKGSHTQNTSRKVPSWDKNEGMNDYDYC